MKRLGHVHRLWIKTKNIMQVSITFIKSFNMLFNSPPSCLIYLSKSWIVLKSPIWSPSKFPNELLSPIRFLNLVMWILHSVRILTLILTFVKALVSSLKVLHLVLTFAKVFMYSMKVLSLVLALVEVNLHMF